MTPIDQEVVRSIDLTCPVPPPVSEIRSSDILQSSVPRCGRASSVSLDDRLGSLDANDSVGGSDVSRRKRVVGGSDNRSESAMGAGGESVDVVIMAMPNKPILPMESIAQIPYGKLFIERYSGPTGDKYLNGARKSDAEWILIVADDMVLLPGYWESLAPHMKEGVGIIYPDAHWNYATRWMKEWHEWRMSTYWPSHYGVGTVLVRRALLASCESIRGLPPKSLSEEHRIHRWVLDNGFAPLWIEGKHAIHSPYIPVEVTDLLWHRAVARNLDSRENLRTVRRVFNQIGEYREEGHPVSPPLLARQFWIAAIFLRQVLFPTRRSSLERTGVLERSDGKVP